MNPGYLTIIVVLSIVILLASGWKDYFLKGLNYKSIILFISGWLISSIIKVDFSMRQWTIHLNAAFIFLIGYSVYLLFRIQLKTAWELLNIFTAALIIALLNITFIEELALGHVYIAICLALAAIVLQKSFFKQLVSLLLGLLGSDLIGFFTQQHPQAFSISDQATQDLWWLTVLLSRLFAVIYENASLYIRKRYEIYFVKK